MARFVRYERERERERRWRWRQHLSQLLLTLTTLPLFHFPQAGIFFLQSPNGEQALTVLFGFASLAFMIASLAVNLALPFLFLNLSIM